MKPQEPNRDSDEIELDMDSNSQELDSSNELPTVSSPTNPNPVGEICEAFGRYESKQLIAQGGFGNVFLGYDPDLDRRVAIKSLHQDRLQSATIPMLLAEARATARLNHPNIVQIFDMDHEPHEGRGYIVMEYVDGPTLAEVLKDERPPLELVVRWMIQVAEGLDHAHSHQLVHRDLKPANILIGPKNRVCVTDFGLALAEDSVHPRRRERAGTPPYMAPEQTSGETHRIDERTDIWSLGVTMYEAISGKRPFRGNDIEDLFSKIRRETPKPLRRLLTGMPADLDRIVMRCLAKQRTNRFLNARELCQELSFLLDQLTAPKSALPRSSSDSGLSGRSSGRSALDSGRAVSIVPKGLRSFDADDAEFFLQLLPGPRDRYGIPEQVRFWRSRIECREEGETFPVGLIYGPSGCGKSSLIRAGVIPLVSAKVRCLYVESNERNTEKSIEDLLRRHHRDIPKEWSLTDVFAAVRNGTIESNTKVMIVLDQFEQWLQSNRGRLGSELASALRQCDGAKIQVILIVRDDFIMSVNDLMAELEVAVAEGENAAAIQRFSVRHARKVLAGFGRAFGAFDASKEELSSGQVEFLKKAVDELSVDGRIIPVHLAIFSELMRDKEWTLESLKSIGGTDGVGVAFLNETFSSSNAPRQLKRLEQPAMNLLEQLLPEMGKQIRGIPCNTDSLMLSSGVTSRGELDELLRTLDQRLRIITKTESVIASDGGNDNAHYQLTHDFLVSPIRRWIRNRRSSTWQGRAALRIEELARYYQRESDSRFIPAPFEFASAVAGRKQVDLSEAARRLMRSAWSYYGLRIAAAALVTLAVISIFTWYGRRQATSLARSEAQRIMQVTPAAHFPLIQSISNQPNRWRVERELRNATVDGVEQRRRLAISVALLSSNPGDEYLPEILKSIEQMDLELAPSTIEALSRINSSRAFLLERFESTIEPIARIRVAMLLVYLDEIRPLEVVFEPAANPSTRSLAIRELSNWRGDPDPIYVTMEESDSAGLRSGYCLALGSTSTTYDSETLEKFVELSKDSSALVSASAEWALRISGKKPTPSIGGSNEWFYQKDGIKFVRVPPDSYVASGASPTSFFISDREISRSLFKKFVSDTQTKWSEPDVFTSNKADVPPTQISYPMATSFCDWLSKRDGMLPVYESKQEPNPNKSIMGYRLPTTLEFEAATRGGAATAYPFGAIEYQDLAKHYEAFSENTAKDGTWYVNPRGFLMPNNYGLFDMLGNVKEWGEYPSEDDPDYRPTWGTTYLTGRFGIRIEATDRLRNPRSGAIAFRLVCDERPPVIQDK